jgi:hypothetical protein
VVCGCVLCSRKWPDPPDRKASLVERIGSRETILSGFPMNPSSADVR